MIRWTDNLLIRFLQACAFKKDKTLACIKEHTVWRETALPPKFTPKIEEFLVSLKIYHSKFSRSLELFMSMEEIIALGLLLFSMHIS